MPPRQEDKNNGATTQLLPTAAAPADEEAAAPPTIANGGDAHRGLTNGSGSGLANGGASGSNTNGTSTKHGSAIGGGLQIDYRTYSTVTDFNDDDDAEEEEKYLFAYANWTDSTVKKMRKAGRFWKKYGVPSVFLFTLLLPVFIFREKYYDDFLKDNWYAALMGFIAVCIPSGGAPVAGGVVFLPILTMVGLDAHAAVAFSSATQALGVGIFTPLSWMDRDPNILMRSFYIPMFPLALGGLVTSYLVTPLQKQEEVEMAFTVFIFFLFIYTLRGLLTNHLDVSPDENVKGGSAAIDAASLEQDPEKARLLKKKNSTLEEAPQQQPQQRQRKSKAERRKLKFTTKQYVIYAITCFFGGILTGWIGIAIEKLTFILLTYIHEVDVVAAGVSSVVLTGFLSQAAFFFHAVCAPPGDGPGPHWQCALRWEDNPEGYVTGNVPYKLWMAVLPGLLLGTIAGPWCNAKIGPRNVMIVFLVFLFFDIVENVNDLFLS